MNQLFYNRFNKFVCIRLNDEQQLSAIIGDFTCDPPGSSNWMPDEKHVVLDQQQFLKFVGLVYNDFTQISRDPRAIDGNMSTMYNLGNDTYFGKLQFGFVFSCIILSLYI